MTRAERDALITLASVAHKMGLRGHNSHAYMWPATPSYRRALRDIWHQYLAKPE